MPEECGGGAGREKGSGRVKKAGRQGQESWEAGSRELGGRVKTAGRQGQEDPGLQRALHPTAHPTAVRACAARPGVTLE